MKKYYILLLLTCFFLCLDAEEYVKGLYLPVDYFKNADTYEKILKEIKEAGFNTFVFDVKDDSGDIHFLEKTKKSNLLLEDILQKAKEYDILPVARIVCFKDPKNYYKHEEYRLRKKDSKKYIKYWLNPSLFEVQKMICNIIDKIAKRGISQIQLDYVRYPAREIFYETGKSFGRNIKSNLSREEIITNFIKFVRILCSKYGVKLSVDVFAIIAWQNSEDIKNIGQNINNLGKYLDYIHPMVYLSHFDKRFMQREVYYEPYYMVYRTIKNIQEKKCEAKIVPYLQAFSYKISFNKEYFYAQIKAVEQAKASGYILWNIKGDYKVLFTWLKEKNTN